MRVVDEEGKNLGVLSLQDAIALAKEKGFDLIEMPSNVSPPVAKIMDFGKFLYKEKRSMRQALGQSKVTETKDIRIHLGTSEHDLGLKAKKASEFLKEGNRIKIDLFLKGREKYMDKIFLRNRLERILNFIPENYKIVGDAKKGPRGMYIIIERNK